MTKSKNVQAFLLFVVFFFIGWEFSLSPVKEGFLKTKESIDDFKNELSGIPSFRLPANYITENQYKIDLLHYSLNIDLYPEKKLLKGDASITGLLLDKTIKHIDLNFYDNMKISELFLNNKKVLYENIGTRLSIPVLDFTADTFNIKVVYQGTPVRAGLAAFVFGEINDMSVVYNLNEPNFASTWFPCNDMPVDKALLDIKITNDSSRTSVSNGALINIETKGDKRTFHWKTYYPISTYLICIYSTNYKKFSDSYISLDKKDTMSIEYYAFPEHLENAKIDFEDHPEMIKFFASIFGEYPFIKEKYGVAEFLWQLGAMEHQTITGIGSNFVSGRKFFNDTYVHELAHHWWGDAVSPATWKDIWLNEGFATYCEALYAEHIAGKKALQSTMLSKFNSNFTGRLYDPGDDLFNKTVYDKGAWVLHMLRWEVGDSTFFNILRKYFESYKYKNASTKDFQKLCEILSNKDLSQFFNQWVLEGDDQVNLDYTWKIKEDENSYKILIALNQTQKYNAYHFPLEIKLDYGGKDDVSKTFYVDGRNKEIEIVVDKKPNDIVLDPNEWLLANIKDKNSYE